MPRAKQTPGHILQFMRGLGKPAPAIQIAAWTNHGVPAVQSALYDLLDQGEVIPLHDQKCSCGGMLWVVNDQNGASSSPS